MSAIYVLMFENSNSLVVDEFMTAGTIFGALIFLG